MPNKGEESHDEQVSPGSKMSAEYSLDDRKIIDDKSPSKMSNKSPQKQPPPKASGKTVTCNVYLLDGENVEISLDKNDVGRALFDKVCTRLDLIEQDYFGLTYTDDRGPSHLKYWLNLDKKISKQKKRGAWVFEFALKFYPPDPSQLRESLTRWLVVLQVRRDLLSGRIPCTFTTYALLGSYNVQADIGEYDSSEHGHSFDYIKDMAFAPNQTPELLEKIAELHKLHKGQTPDEAEKGFLDNAKKLAMYGIDLHKAKDSENNAVMIGVCCSGLLIFRDKLRLNRFVWPKILKLSYKRNHFYIKIRPGEMERNETTIMFKLDNHRLAKRLWKTCVEHHAFFRLREAEKPTNNVSFPRFGSKFRYSGRTLYQTRQTAALLDRPPPFFERSQPARNTIHDASNRSRSMDELGRNRPGRGSYDDGMYDPTGANKDYDPNRYGDEKDRRDLKGVDPATAKLGRGGDGHGAGDEDTLQRRPYDSDTADRRDRVPSQGDATLEHEKGRGHGHDDSMGLTAGGAVDGYGKPETEKERRKREKEEDKKRKEEQRRQEEEERKKNKGKNKRGKGDLDTSEDRTDKLGQGEATERAQGYGPGSAGLEGDKLLLTGPHAGDESGTDKDKHKDKDGFGKDSPGARDGYYKDGKWYPYNGDGSHPGKDGLDEDNKKYPYGKNKHGSDNDDDGYGKDGKGRDGKGKDGKDKDGKDKEKDKKGGLFGRLKKGKHGDSDADDSPKGKAGKGDKDKDKGRKGGFGDEPDITRDKQGHPLGSSPGYPYGVGLGLGKGDMTGVVGQEKSVDNKQRFIPTTQPVKGTKESLKSGYSDNMMPFFHPAATSTVGRGKVPPPVPPKGGHGLDDSFNYKTEKDGVEETRVVQKVTMSGGDEDDDYDFDAALADAIRSVTEFNPDMSVERIECVQQIEDVKSGK